MVTPCNGRTQTPVSFLKVRCQEGDPAGAPVRCCLLEIDRFVVFQYQDREFFVKATNLSWVILLHGSIKPGKDFCPLESEFALILHSSAYSLVLLSFDCKTSFPSQGSCWSRHLRCASSTSWREQWKMPFQLYSWPSTMRSGDLLTLSLLATSSPVKQSWGPSSVPGAKPNPLHVLVHWTVPSTL